LGAIQDLNQKVEAETAALRAENAAFKQELAELKRLVHHQANPPPAQLTPERLGR
jgi:hypothetical protein